MKKILIAEDDADLRKIFQTVLKKEGYEVITADDGLMAIRYLQKEYVDLIISDIMMPNMDGFQLIRSLRDAGQKTPILLITAREGFDDMRKGFSLGTDDYMIKPVNMNELILRVEALIRRSQMQNERRQTFGSLTLELDSMTLTVGEDSQILPQKEFMLLYKLLNSAGKTFTRQQLMDDIWGSDSPSDIRTVDVHINRLRERLRGVSDYEIVTIRGLGYKAVYQNKA